MSARHAGTSASEELTSTRNLSNSNVLNTTADGVTVSSITDGSQIHVWGQAGDDTINIAFEDLGSYTKGHHVRGDQKRFSDGLFHDDFVFQELDEVHSGAILVGRIEDFDRSRDRIFIEDIRLDLTQGSGQAHGYEWKVVHFDVDTTDAAVGDQQWLLIDTAGGYVFYALEGARVTRDGLGGANNGEQEEHFASYNSVSPENVTEDIWRLNAVGYVDPVNHVPLGHVAQGGYIINDYDDAASDLRVIEGSTSGDLIAAGLNDDAVLAHEGNDKLWGGSGNDTLNGGEGEDTLNGGTGHDTAAYSGNQSSYILSLSPTSATLTDRRKDGNGTDMLIDMELLDFDADILGAPFNLEWVGGSARLSELEFRGFIELYIAYFNRAPDAVGLNFWGTAFSNGTTLEEMATLFIDQPETVAAYPEGTSNTVFAETVFNNVLGRTPDQAGLDFWVGVLDAGDVTRGQFILEVLRGAKSDLKPEEGQAFVDQQLADREFLTNKTDIGAYFAVHKGMSDVDNAAAAMALFDGSEASIDTAVSTIDDYYADALDPETGEFIMQVVGVLDDPFAGS